MKRILIVDDDRATSAGMADVVEEWGYEPELADTVKATDLFPTMLSALGAPPAPGRLGRALPLGLVRD